MARESFCMASKDGDVFRETLSSTSWMFNQTVH